MNRTPARNRAISTPSRQPLIAESSPRSSTATAALSWPKLQVLYDVHGRTDVPDLELAHWEGYARSTTCAAAVKSRLDEAKLLAGFGRSVLEIWAEPDNGIWEIRGGCRDYTLSKVWCWVALDCLLQLQERGVVDVDTAPIRAGREAIANVIESRGFNTQLQSYVQTFDGDRADASLLLMACLGYKDPNDPRMRGTYDPICERLGRNGLLYKYERDVDGLPPGEGAFGICSFWAVDYLVARARDDGCAQAHAPAQSWRHH